VASWGSARKGDTIPYAREQAESARKVFKDGEAKPLEKGAFTGNRDERVKDAPSGKRRSEGGAFLVVLGRNQPGVRGATEMEPERTPQPWCDPQFKAASWR